MSAESSPAAHPSKAPRPPSSEERAACRWCHTRCEPSCIDATMIGMAAARAQVMVNTRDGVRRARLVCWHPAGAPTRSSSARVEFGNGRRLSVHTNRILRVDEPKENPDTNDHKGGA